MPSRKPGEKYDHTVRDFGGINTQARRQAIDDTEFAWLENLMPIGSGNMVSVPGPTDTGATVAGTCYYMKAANISNVNYMFMFTSDGAAYQINLTTYVKTTVAAAATFSGTSSQIDQWKNERIVIIDPNGYWDWNGAALTKHTLLSAPAAGTSIAVYAGRVWASNNRTVQYSAPSSYTDFTTGALGGSFVVEDSTLHSNITQLLSANGFLYIFGVDSINVVSDVRVSTTPAATLFSNLNLTTTAGTSSPGSVVSYYRTIWLAAPYGFYGITGSSAQKGSDKLDGIFPYIASATGFSAGTVVLNRVLCLAFMFIYADPTTNTNRTILAVFFNKTWIICSQGDTLTQCASCTVDGTQALYATDGTKLWKLFSDTSAAISQKMVSKLWDMGDPLLDKQVLKLGFETIQPGVIGTVTASIDSETGSRPATLIETSDIYWTNDSLTVLGWINNSLASVVWVSSGYVWYRGDVSSFGKYAGVTFTTSIPGLTIMSAQIQYELRARW